MHMNNNILLITSIGFKYQSNQFQILLIIKGYKSSFCTIYHIACLIL